MNTIFNIHMPFLYRYISITYTLYSTVYTHLNDDSPSNGEVPVKPCMPYSPSIALNPYHLKPTLVQLRLRFHLYIRAQVSVGLTPCGNSSLLHNCYSYMYLHISWICLTFDYTKALKIRKINQSMFWKFFSIHVHVSTCIWVKYWTIQ